MPLNSPTAKTKNNIIYGSLDDPIERCEDKDSLELEELDDESTSHASDSPVKVPSVCVERFEDIFRAVLLHDSHLLSSEEKNVLCAFQHLSYEARCLLLRLALSLPDNWYRVSSLKDKYYRADDIIHAIVELCRPIMSTAWLDTDVKRKMEEDEKQDIEIKVEVSANGSTTAKDKAKLVIDLTFDDSDEEEFEQTLVRGGKRKSKLQGYHSTTRLLLASPSSMKTSPRTRTVSAVDRPSKCNARTFNRQDKFDPNYFCYCESSMSLLDLLECLTIHELKTLAKQMKIKTSQNRSSLISAVLATSSTQTVLNFVSMGKANAKTKLDGDRQTTLGVSAKGNSQIKTQEERLRDIVLGMLEKCVRINHDISKLFRRVHIIYFRCTEYPTSTRILTLLTSLQNCNYAKYTCERNSGIWPDRAVLLTYEEALEIQARIDGEVEGTSTVVRGRGNKTAGRSKFVGPTAAGTQNSSIARGMDTDDWEVKVDSARVQEARMAGKILEEVFPKWKKLVSVKEKQSEAVVGVEGTRTGLEWFEPGHIFTRIAHKGAQALGVLKEYAGELEVLEALLEQKIWRRGRRGMWYERRAVILTTYLCREEKSKTLTRAIEGVKEALMDDDTGLVYRPSLVRRLVRLEKMLGLPPEARCVWEAQSRKVTGVTVEAVRLWNALGGERLATPIKSEEGVCSTPTFTRGAKAMDTPLQKRKDKEPEIPRNKWKRNSVWLGRGDEKVTVETRALQYYEELGYKGHHSKTYILTTIFALLFWDIIFAAIPGAFETRYQFAPLDMSEDTFYYARKDLIAQRLMEIEDGGARSILERHDAMYKKQESRCVGVRWDICDGRDLVEIVECLGGKSVSIICQLFCEDYAGRSTGIPDLIIWNMDEGVCKFIEVKGPGQNLRDHEKIWMDVLVRGGTAVELCRIVEEGQASKKRRAKSKGPSMANGKRAVKKTQMQSDSESEPESEDEDQVDQLDDDPWQPHVEIAVEQTTARYHMRGRKRWAPDEQSTLASSSLVLSPVKKRRLGGRHSS